MNKKGFTLIEMLVVIAIIAILVSIVIPTVSSATDKAAAATNAANLRAVYAELQTDILSQSDNEEGYVHMKDGVPSLVGTPAPAAIKDVVAKTATMQLNKDKNNVNYGDGLTIDFFAKMAETGKASS